MLLQIRQEEIVLTFIMVSFNANIILKSPIIGFRQQQNLYSRTNFICWFWKIFHNVQRMAPSGEWLLKILSHFYCWSGANYVNRQYKLEYRFIGCDKCKCYYLRRLKALPRTWKMTMFYKDVCIILQLVYGVQTLLDSLILLLIIFHFRVDCSVFCPR